METEVFGEIIPENPLDQFVNRIEPKSWFTNNGNKRKIITSLKPNKKTSLKDREKIGISSDEDSGTINLEPNFWFSDLNIEPALKLLRSQFPLMGGLIDCVLFQSEDQLIDYKLKENIVYIVNVNGSHWVLIFNLSMEYINIFKCLSLKF